MGYQIIFIIYNVKWQLKRLNLTFLLVISYDENKTEKYAEKGIRTHKN